MSYCCLFNSYCSNLRLWEQNISSEYLLKFSRLETFVNLCTPLYTYYTSPRKRYDWAPNHACSANILHQRLSSFPWSLRCSFPWSLCYSFPWNMWCIICCMMLPLKFQFLTSVVISNGILPVHCSTITSRELICNVTLLLVIISKLLILGFYSRIFLKGDWKMFPQFLKELMKYKRK